MESHTPQMLISPELPRVADAAITRAMTTNLGSGTLRF